MPLYVPVQIQIVILGLQLTAVTQILPLFRISIRILTSIRSLIFHGTGCTYDFQWMDMDNLLKIRPGPGSPRLCIDSELCHNVARGIKKKIVK